MKPFYLFLFLALGAQPLPAHAAVPLAFDPSFGVQGQLVPERDPFLTALFPKARYGGRILDDGRGGLFEEVSGQDGQSRFTAGFVHREADGQIDRQFGTAGYLDLDHPLQDAFVDAQGRLTALLAAIDFTQTLGQGQGFLLERFLPGGQPDPAFGTGGRVDARLGRRQFPLRVLPGRAGELVVLGYGLYPTQEGQQSLLIARLTPGDTAPRVTELPFSKGLLPVPSFYKNDDFTARVDPRTGGLRLGFSVGGIDGLRIYTSYVLLGFSGADQLTASGTLYLHEASYVDEHVPALLRGDEIVLARQTGVAASDALLRVSFPTGLNEAPKGKAEISLADPARPADANRIFGLAARAGDLFVFGGSAGLHEPAVYQVTAGANQATPVAPFGDAGARFHDCYFTGATAVAPGLLGQLFCGDKATMPETFAWVRFR